MKLKEIVELVKGTEHYVPDDYDVNIKYAGLSDLMSDVLAYLSKMPLDVSHEMMLITGLASPQIIRIADITDMSLILMSRGKEPTGPIIEGARNANVAIISTPLTSFTACGLLYTAGIKGIDNEVVSE